MIMHKSYMQQPSIHPVHPTILVNISSSRPADRPSLTLHLEDGLGQAADVLARDASDGDTTVLGGVHAVLLGERIHLLGRQAGVGEHADLARDVAPVVLAAELLEVLLQESAHGDDAIGHALDLAEPLVVQLGGVEDLGGDARAVDRRVGVQRADQDLDLAVDALLLLDRVGKDGESADTLTIETLIVR